MRKHPSLSLTAERIRASFPDNQILMIWVCVLACSNNHTVVNLAEFQESGSRCKAEGGRFGEKKKKFVLAYCQCMAS